MIDVNETLSEAFDSNVFNVIVGFLLPGAILGIASETGSGLLVPFSYAALTGVRSPSPSVGTG